MARLRVLKPFMGRRFGRRGNHFTHHGPFEGTETDDSFWVFPFTDNFTHHGPFEGTETCLWG